MGCLLKDTKRYIKHFYINGEWLEEPNLKFKGNAISEDTKGFLSELFHFFLDSKYLSKVSKIYINSHASTIRGAIEDYNIGLPKDLQININTGQSNIQYDKKKIAKTFESNMITNVIAYPEIYISKYKESLIGLYPEYTENKGYGNCTVLKLSKYITESEISDKDYNDLLKVLKLYSKETIKKIERGEHLLTKDMIGYFNYLTSAPILTDTEKTRLGKINEILGL